MTDTSSNDRTLTSNERVVPTFEGRLFTDSERHGLAGNWVRRAEVDVLLDEIERLRGDLFLSQNAVSALGRQRSDWKAAYEGAIQRNAHETLHVGASDWEEFGIAVRTVSQNCDMIDIARRGDWLQRELRARGFDIVRSGREDTPDEFRSAHVINVPWCQCCEARVPADHVCACEVIAEPSKEWWKCEYSGPGGQCGRDNHYARATCWYCHHPRVNAQKAKVVLPTCAHGATSEEVCPECMGLPSDNPDEEIS